MVVILHPSPQKDPLKSPLITLKVRKPGKLGWWYNRKQILFQNYQQLQFLIKSFFVRTLQKNPDSILILIDSYFYSELKEKERCDCNIQTNWKQKWRTAFLKSTSFKWNIFLWDHKHESH